MKKIHHILAIPALLFSLAGCELDFVPQTSISSSNLNEEDYQYLLVGAYSAAHNFSMGHQYVIDDICADNLSNAVSPLSKGNFEDYDVCNVQGNSYRLQYLWEELFTALQTCNNAINLMEAAEQADEMTGMIAQLKVIRCWEYQRLVSLWGDVPLLTELTDEMVARDPEIEIWKLMVEDCEYAIDHAPEFTGSEYVSSIAAKAMLARVLCIAPEGVRDTQRAATLAEEVIASPLFALADDPKRIWLNKDSNELIFMFKNSDIDGVSPGWFLRAWQWEIDQLVEAGGTKGEAANGRHMFTVDLSLLNAFELGDKRKDASIRDLRCEGHRESVYLDCIKYPNNTGLFDDPWPVIRIAEMYLIAAEAVGYPNGVARLNDLRTVRGLQPLTAGTDITADNFMKRIMQERRVELCFEGHRWYDLRRWWNMGEAGKQAVLELRSYQNGESAGSRPTASDYMNIANDGHNLLLPLPASILTSDPNLLPNNPGY